MEKNYPVEMGILLLDHYDEMADLLKQSFRLAGFTGPVLVLEDKGFLPLDVLSVFRWFCQDVSSKPTKTYRWMHAGWQVGNPRYFNQIELPDYWEISGNNNGAEIHDLHHLRGRIFYAPPKHRRLVSEVDWLNEDGIVRCTDHYDDHGILYARTIFNRTGKRFCRSWFDGAGHECVVENYVTGDIIVNRHHKTFVYKNRTAFAIEMLHELKADGQCIFYNSLSTPLFISESFSSKNLLFWQDGARNDIPGHMQMILKGQSHTSKIYVQDQASWQKLVELGASKEWLQPFGFIYPFVRKNQRRPHILICTNSDQIEELEFLVTHLSQMVFHIAAITEMSSRLLAFGKYPHVKLYPTVKTEVVDDLFQICDYYFDINHGDEILSSVKRAFLNDQLILGFTNTIHRRRYIAKEHIFSDAKELCALASDTEKLPAALDRQKKAAISEDVEAYRALFDHI